MDTLFGGEAQIHYTAANFTILNMGAYVACAVSGERIPIEQLRYWSEDRQEAYRDAAASLEAWKRAQK